MAVAVKLLPVLDHGNEFEKFDQDRNRHDGEAIPSISKNKRIRVYHGDTEDTEKTRAGLGSKNVTNKSLRGISLLAE